MTDDDLLNGFKNSIRVPKDYHDDDQILKQYLQGSRAYMDSVLDQSLGAKTDPLYWISITQLATFEWLNRDDTKTKSYPIGLQALINKLKTSYLK